MSPKSMIIAALIVSGLSAASFSAHAQSRQHSYQAYAIVDFKTDRPKDEIIGAAERILDGYASDFASNRPIGVPVPSEPGRFELVNPLANSQLGGLAALAGVRAQSFMVATCNGAVWQADVTRRINNSQELRATLCLFPYRNEAGAGYHLDLFASDTAISGGGISMRLGRALANRLVGTPREFTENMMRQTVQAIEMRTGAEAVVLEVEPFIAGLGTITEAQSPERPAS